MVLDPNVMEVALEALAGSAGMSLVDIVRLAMEPGDDPDPRERMISNWRAYVKPSAIRKMSMGEAIAALINAHRKANEEEWD